MNIQRLLLAGLLGMLLASGPAGAQSYLPSYSSPPQNINQTPSATAAQQGDGDVIPRFKLSDWITYDSRNYQPPDGVIPVASPPIINEIFVRAGPSTPFGSGIYAATLNTGWMIDVGTRANFFNPGFNRAWIIEGSISNTYNAANSSTFQHPLSINLPQAGVIAPKTVTIKGLDQTFINLGGGRDWYFNPFGGHHLLRFGVDAGGRYGFAKADFNEVPHRSGTIYGAYGAMHADLMIPCGGCRWFVCGVRGEWDLMQDHDMLQTTVTLQSISLMLNMGLRF